MIPAQSALLLATRYRVVCCAKGARIAGTVAIAVVLPKGQLWRSDHRESEAQKCVTVLRVAAE